MTVQNLIFRESVLVCQIDSTQRGAFTALRILGAVTIHFRERIEL